MSLIGQWSHEFSRRVIPNSVRVMTYYGPDRDRHDLFSSDRSWDVVITTYGVLISEWKKFHSTNTTSRSRCSDGIFQHRWKRVLLDEAHCIRNQNTDAFKACCNVTSECRWVITGTPIQNKIDDLFSLIKFLQHEPWNQYRWWNKTILQPLNSGDQQGLRVLKELLQSIMLRRTKNSLDLVTGKRILDLPPKTIEMVYVDLQPNERSFYEAFARRSQELSISILRTFSGQRAGRSSIKGYAALFTLLMRLRQICNHPFLVLKSLTSFSDEVGPMPSGQGSSKIQDFIRSDRKSQSEYMNTILQKLDKYLESSQDDDETVGLSNSENIFDQECVVCLELLEVSHLSGAIFHFSIATTLLCY